MNEHELYERARQRQEGLTLVDDITPRQKREQEYQQELAKQKEYHAARQRHQDRMLKIKILQLALILIIIGIRIYQALR